MGQLYLTICDMAGNALPQEWAIEDVISATIMMEELDKFSPHTVTVTGSFRRNLALLNGIATVKIADTDIGLIAWGVLENPEEQIVASDAHTITLQLPNITEQLRYETTGQGWVAGGVNSPLSLRTIVQRLGALKKGWSADAIDYGTDPYILRFEDEPILAALLDTAKATFGHARQGRDPLTGEPIRTIEIGNFGSAPTVELIAPEGGSANDIIISNPNARIVQSITRYPADATKLTNVLTPLGGGDGDQQVKFRHLWRILHDTTYDHYAATPALLATYFPEYDLNFPIPGIGDPAQGGKIVPARPMKGDSNQWEIAARLDGTGYEYGIVHAASLAQYNALYPGEGIFRSQFIDSQFSYTDAVLFNQEMVERALYVAAKAQLQWYGQPQRTIAVTTVGNRRPPRAGDLVAINYRRTGSDDIGPFNEMEEASTYTVVSVQRSYALDGVATDTMICTNNGKGPPDAEQNAADATRKLVEAIRSVPTVIACASILGPYKDNIDGTHPITIPIDIPSSVFRVQQATLKVAFQPHRASVDLDGAGPIKTGGISNPQGQTLTVALTPGQDATLTSTGIPTDSAINTYTGQLDGTTSTNSTILPADMLPIGFSGSYGNIVDAQGNTVVIPSTGPAAGQTPASFGKIVDGAGNVIATPSSQGATGTNPSTFGHITINGSPVGSATTGLVAGGYDVNGNISATGSYSQPYAGTTRFDGNSGLALLSNGAAFIGNWADSNGQITAGGGSGNINTNDPNISLTHVHKLPYIAGNTQPAGNQLFVVSPGGTANIGVNTAGASGNFQTNAWVQSGSGSADGTHKHPYSYDTTHGHNALHGHQTTIPTLAQHTHSIAHAHDITHAHDISHAHDITHGHDIAHAHRIDHSHDFRHTHTFAHTHDFRHTHKFTHTHNYDHHHNFPHTHAMIAGIFETVKPGRVQLWIDGVDRSPEFGGPWTNDFALIDIGKYVNKPGNTVVLDFISVDLGNGNHGLGALSISGTWIFEIGSAASTIFAA